MSNLRKLQTEIDRVMKKVDEGVDLFDEIWEKVYSAEQQNQKEKYEMDLKKEIKKLQRLRDQIKTWIGSSDVKDKDNLIEARKLIETKMEQFKICEKETKTKTYSKEGLARQEKLDPAEEARRKTTKWIGEYIEKFNSLVEDREVEIEKLSAGKGKKTNKHLIEEYNDFITNHKFHINKLEGIMRLVNNDRLDVELVDALKEDIDYYLEAYEEDDYMQSYDEEYFYESLGLEELDVVNVDRVTQISSGGRTSSATSVDDESMSSSKTGGKEKSSKKKSSSTVIPLTIGRARAASSGEKEKPTTPSKIGRSVSATITQTNNSNHSGVGLGPAPKPAPPVQTGGASMASILKREGEQQEKERQKALQQQQQLLREQQARAQQEQLRQQQLLRQQQEQAQQQLRQQEALRQQQQQQQQKAAAQQEALKRQQIQLQEQQAQQRAQQEAAAKQQQQQQQLQAQQQAAVEQKKLAQQRAAQHTSGGGTGGTLDILSSGLGGLSLGNVDQRLSDAVSSPMPSLSAVSPQQPQQSSSVDSNAYLSALNESYAHIPSGSDNERQRTYTPKNPYPTPSAYPTTPSQLFEGAAVFEKLGTDCLFFIFYYSQGTYQQYLAARELKKQSWRYHKKYMTWFQRHEEPKVTTDEYEEGTYVYFDYEAGWCQRIKHDFRFEYRFLEDSLA